MKNVGMREALSKVASILVNNIDKNEKVIRTFIDLQKAFDTVNHEILLEKLYRSEIGGKSVEFLKS